MILCLLASLVIAAPASEPTAVEVARFYLKALGDRDAAAADSLFSAESVVYETGGQQGTWSHYRLSHLAPELEGIESFQSRLGEPTSFTSADGSLTVVTWPLDYRVGVNGQTTVSNATATFVVEHSGSKSTIRHLHWSSRPATTDRFRRGDQPTPASFADALDALRRDLEAANIASEAEEFTEVVRLASQMERVSKFMPGLGAGSHLELSSAARTVENHSLVLGGAAAAADKTTVAAALAELWEAIRELQAVPNVRMTRPRPQPSRSQDHGGHAH